MAGLTVERAERFWAGVADAVERGTTLLWAARRDDGQLIGTVQLQLATYDNQPHRAEVAKLLVRRSARRRGVGETLMGAAEAAAVAIGRTTLVLDTASPEAERIYRRRGWQVCGVIPDYALMPDGTRCATTVYWKRLGGAQDEDSYSTRPEGAG
jgi:GNAT superfamily N-acetyltransferase